MLCKVSRALACSVYLLSLILPANAQVEQGTITGTVTDPSGAAIPGVKVTITNQQTRVSSETRTNGDGNYRVPFLAPGEYEIVAEKEGFTNSRVSAIPLTVGLTATINTTLTVV